MFQVRHPRLQVLEDGHLTDSKGRIATWGDEDAGDAGGGRVQGLLIHGFAVVLDGWINGYSWRGSERKDHCTACRSCLVYIGLRNSFALF